MVAARESNAATAQCLHVAVREVIEGARTVFTRLLPRIIQVLPAFYSVRLFKSVMCESVSSRSGSI